jgi:hypothetical protein
VTTARALLRRLLRQGRLDPGVPTKAPDEPAAGQRLDEARQRLKQTIPPPEDASRAETAIPPPEDASRAGTAIPPTEDASRAGTAIPPPEGVSPEEKSPPVP